MPITRPATDRSAGGAAQPFVERRAVGRALDCWDRLRTGSRFPSRADCLAAFDSGLIPGLVVIAVGAHEEDDRIVECGPAFRAALGYDPVGARAQDVLPCATERGLVFWRVAAQMRKPVADFGGFTNAAGQEILYRGVFLPVSEDGRRITHLVAAFSYTAVP